MLLQLLPNKIQKYFDYVFYQKNYFTVVFYIIIGPSAFLHFLFNVYKPNFYNFGYLNLLAICSIAVFGFYSFYKLVVSDPGIVDSLNKETVYEKYKQEFDGKIYIEKKECKTCLFQKPAKSKHCSLCNKCIEQMDHHCPWINNCVGVNNLGWFNIYIITHIVLCLYMFILCFVQCCFALTNMIDSVYVDSFDELKKAKHNFVALYISMNRHTIAYLVISLTSFWILTIFYATLYWRFSRKITISEVHKIKVIKDGYIELLKKHQFKNNEEKDLILNRISQFLETAQKKIVYKGYKGYL